MTHREETARRLMRDLRATDDWRAVSQLGAVKLRAYMVDAVAAQWVAVQDEETRMTMADAQDMIETVRSHARALGMVE